MYFQTYLFTAAILLAAEFAEPFSELEAECSTSSAAIASPDSVVPVEKFFFRTDNFTQAEYFAYSVLVDGSTPLCDIGPLVQSFYHQVEGESTIYLTYIEARCLDGVRAAAAQLTRNIHNISSDRAVTLQLHERADTDDPVHYDVIDPVRQLLIELHVLRCVTATITGKIYAAGTLPNLVTLELQGGRNLTIRKRDFSQMQNVQMIRFVISTIAMIETHTFTDLPRLKSLMLEYDLGLELMALHRGHESPLTEADFAVVRRLHCDCSLAWLRNFLKQKLHLAAPKETGEVAVIGSYRTPAVTTHEEFPSVFSVDCTGNLTYDNIRAGTHFSYNTSCYDVAQC
ncbi:uncharacterized protein LOC129594552 [Paramacrobiotus metropolitanus]|uniref:uncharacterized protein LOC129594552 n=1 Tax=Paramacrobiotus metropolitanus TaxID=2943436 RepID=UPI0024460458|nr:uncharacterized protein LOC129594552 [Paramacrobiotus metropolitanus]